MTVKDMTLHDLATGMIVTTRNGQEWTVFRNYSCTMASTEEDNTDGVLVRGINDWLSFSAYNEDMTTNFHKELYDIVKVEISSHPCSMMYHDFRKFERRLIWEREPVKEVTMEDVEAMFGCRVKIVP